MRKRWGLIGLLFAAGVALAFIQVDDTNDQNIAGFKTFINSIAGSAAGVVKTSGVAVASLPVCDSTTSQSYGFAIDASACNGGTAVGGGTEKCAVVCDGTSWKTLANGAPSATATPAPTATPLAFGTPNALPKFAATELGSSGATDDGSTFTLAARDFSYGQALYVTGVRAISTSVGANATDRFVDCTSGSSTDKTYTLPTATGSQRVIDFLKVDSGTKSCLLAVPSGALNAGTAVTLGTPWFGETCRDVAAGQWYCRGQGTVS